jgi:hypothetical protein
MGMFSWLMLHSHLYCFEALTQATLGKHTNRESLARQQQLVRVDRLVNIVQQANDFNLHLRQQTKQAILRQQLHGRARTGWQAVHRHPI